MIGQVRTLALELAPYDVTVNAVCPTVVDSPMLDHLVETGKAYFQEVARLCGSSTVFPGLENLEPATSRHAVQWLASDAAALRDRDRAARRRRLHLQVSAGVRPLRRPHRTRPPGRWSRPRGCHSGSTTTAARASRCCLLGGFTAGHFAFDFVRPLLRTPRRLITWEPRGLGLSACPDPAAEPYSVAVWAEDRRRPARCARSWRGSRFGRWGSAATSPIASPRPIRDRVGALVTYTDVWARDPAKGYPQIWEVYGAIVRNFGTTGFGARVLANVFDVSDVPLVRRLGGAQHRSGAASRDGRGDGRLLPARGRRARRPGGDRGADAGGPGQPHLGRARARPGRRPLADADARAHADLEVASIADAHPGYVYVQQPERAAAAAEAFLDAHPLDAG